MTGVQLPAVTGEDLNRAGWQEGLRRALFQTYPEIKLSIASFGSEPYQPFTVENATYHNIFRQKPPENRWKRLIHSWKHITYDHEELDRIYKVYDSIQPDLVFIFGTENPFGLLATRFSVPTVVSIQAVLHSLVERIFDGLSTVELIKEIFSRDTVVGTGIFHRWWTLKKYLKTEKTIYKRCWFYTGRTEWDKTWLKRLNPAAIYFHIDRVLGEPYYQGGWDLQKSNPNQIFTVSSNAPFKGGITLVRALAILKDRGSDDIQLRIAGINPASRVGEYIKRLVDKHNLQNQVTLLGRIQPGDIVKEMQQARLFVLPSHMDNSPNSLAEAMLLGMPCIASNAGGIPSMLKKGVEGVLYNHQDINALADVIKKILTDSELASSLGAQARKTAQTRHDPGRIAQDTYHIYQEVLSSQ
jgi:glycosyltransferase involved in cell wall biosynthesis